MCILENEEPDPQEERRESRKADESALAEVVKCVQQLASPEISAEDIPAGNSGSVHHGKSSIVKRCFHLYDTFM